MKTYSLKVVATKLNRWVGATRKLLEAHDIEPLYTQKAGARTYRVYDKKTIDTFVRSYKARHVVPEDEAVPAAEQVPTITDPIRLSVLGDLKDAINRLTAAVVSMEREIKKNTAAAAQANELMLEQLTHPDDRPTKQ